MEPIPVSEARKHWLDYHGDDECHQVQRARDEVWRWYEQTYYAPGQWRGRRWRGRILSWANQQYCYARRACPVCSRDVLWDSGFIARSPHKPGGT